MFCSKKSAKKVGEGAKKDADTPCRIPASCVVRRFLEIVFETDRGCATEFESYLTTI
jgi:hypothetical protein